METPNSAQPKGKQLYEGCSRYIKFKQNLGKLYGTVKNFKKKKIEQTPGALAIHLGRKENDSVYEENQIENHTYLSTFDMRTTPKV
jgi:hypothetical protein